MSYNNYYMRLRVKAVQEFDRMYHEPEYKAKCHKRVWKRLGCYIFGISYQSYLDYLKMDVSDVPPTPLEAQHRPDIQRGLSGERRELHPQIQL